MPHYARVLDDLVVEIITADEKPIARENYDEFWIEIPQRMGLGIQLDPSKPTVAVGYTYEFEQFVPPRPYHSWNYSASLKRWVPPVGQPSDNKQYMWNEKHREWTATGYYYDENRNLVKEE